MKNDWGVYSAEDCYDDLFASEFVQSVSNNQVLIMIRDSKRQDDDYYYDVAIYDSAFPYLQNKRYSGDCTYFYIPFPYIVDTIGHRFEGQYQDVVDFLTYNGVSLPDIMGLDTIQRAYGMTNMFGIVLARQNCSLSALHSREHDRIVSVSSVIADSSGFSTKETCESFQVVLSKLGWNFSEFQTQLRAFAGPTFDVCLLVDHASNYDLIGGRMKFHEAINLDIDPFNQISMGIMEGFVREAIEELGFSHENIESRGSKNGVQSIRVHKEGRRYSLRIYKHPDLFLGIVEVEAES